MYVCRLVFVVLCAIFSSLLFLFIETCVVFGAFRPVGCDIAIGQCLLSAGQVIGASEIGLLASVGVASVKCYQLPRVGVMSTGNEVLFHIHQYYIYIYIYNNNIYMTAFRPFHSC